MDDFLQTLGEYKSPLILTGASILGWVVRVIRDHAEGKRLPWYVILANFISACCLSGLSGTVFVSWLGMGGCPAFVSAFSIGFSTDVILTAISRLGEKQLLRGKK